MSRKLKLIDTYRQFENVERFMKRAGELKQKQAKPSTRRLRAVFARLFEETELKKIVYQKAMATPGANCEDLFHCITDREGTCVLRSSIYRSQIVAKAMIERLEKSSEECGCSVEIMDAVKKDVIGLPGFRPLMEECANPKIAAVKAVRNGKESLPIIFTPDDVLVQREEGPVGFRYSPYNNFTYLFNGLAFR